jgi:hypothetical protein
LQKGNLQGLGEHLQQQFGPWTWQFVKRRMNQRTETKSFPRVNKKKVILLEKP